MKEITPITSFVESGFINLTMTLSGASPKTIHTVLSTSIDSEDTSITIGAIVGTSVA